MPVPHLRRTPVLLASGLVLVNILAWIWAVQVFGGSPALLGTALLAYLLGLRHAVDADHIAAIDNTVRKLMQEGGTPWSTGFFFSLGHASVVLIAVALIAGTTSALQDKVLAFRETGSLIGTGVSSLFLLLIAVFNLMVLRDVWQHFRQVRRGRPLDDNRLDLLLGGRGFLSRLLRPLFALVTHSRHMWLIGFLFGLGFDTATEIGLFAMTATHAADGIAPWHIMVLPVLFAAGMALVDTLDSMLMVGAYGWAFIHPLRKLWYNLTITLISALIAIVIGGLEALGLVARALRPEGAFWDLVARLNEHLAEAGYAIIGLFVLAWIVSALVYKLGRFEAAA